MKKKERLLPELNQCFLQRKAFDIHRKKLQYIKNSIKQPPPLSTSPTPKPSSLHQSLRTINEQPHSTMNKVPRMTPYQRQQQLMKHRENIRLYDKIQRCRPSISRHTLDRHQQQSIERKDRLCRFSSHPHTQRTLLKSIRSLQALQKKESQRMANHSPVTRTHLTHHPTRNHSRTKTEAIDENQMRPASTVSQKSKLTNKRRDNICSNLLALRYSTKVQTHFSHTPPTKKIQVSWGEGGLSGRADKTWKRRCFTTEVE